MVYAVITGRRRYDLNLDQVCETLALAKREVRDLKKMGYDDARWMEFHDECAADEWVAKNS